MNDIERDELMVELTEIVWKLRNLGISEDAILDEVRSVAFEDDEEGWVKEIKEGSLG